MKLITFNSGYIVVNNPEVESKVQSLLLNGNFWEYISVLLENDVSNKNKVVVEADTEQLENKMDKLEKLLMQVINNPVTEKPTPTVTQPPKPKQVKPTKTNFSGKNNSFLAAAKRAKDFR